MGHKQPLQCRNQSFLLKQEFGDCPPRPTISSVLENLPLRGLIFFLMGNEWRRRVQNLGKTNEQVFLDYLNLIASSKSRKWCYETRWLLNRFFVFLGEYPPTIGLFTKFFSSYSGLAAVYYGEMVYHGKNHRQAMGAVMSHLGARVLRVLKEDRPYEIRNLEGKSIDKGEAKRLILSQYYVSEEVQRERRRRNTKAKRKGVTETVSIHKAAKAPPPVQITSVSQK